MNSHAISSIEVRPQLLQPLQQLSLSSLTDNMQMSGFCLCRQPRAKLAALHHCFAVLTGMELPSVLVGAYN